MRKCASAMLILLLTLAAGCGLFYQAASGYRANQMEKTLKPGMTSLEVHKMWGEPDIRNYVDQHTAIWSYAKHANSGDVTAAVLYTSAKEGDQGSFLDLKFDDGKLVSWNEATHMMPKKEGSGFNAGLGGSPQGGTVHY
jgi:outer membrane protein assembly factor BamE (lipoprotein component of BamABCDE complex)